VPGGRPEGLKSGFSLFKGEQFGGGKDAEADGNALDLEKTTAVFAVPRVSRIDRSLVRITTKSSSEKDDGDTDYY
jgi:hypothetical protein